LYLSSVDSFLLGLKPSCYENRMKLTAAQVDELRVYPQYDDNDEFTLYFCDEGLKQQFLNSIAGKDRTSSEYIKLFGDVLGYPPKATAFFANYQVKRKQDVKEASRYFQCVRVNMLYGGVPFMSHVENIEENTLWLWERYRHNSPLRLKVFHEEVPVQIVVHYRDFDELKYGAKQCAQFLHFKPVYT
jgi:hypothetical protein